MIGAFIIDKPAGMTSHDVVARVRRAARTRRVGHAGTLDPFATDFLVRVRCSSGTYVRTLAHDIGVKLGTGAHLSALRRTAVGHFLIEDALSLDEVERRGRDGSLS